MDEVFINPATVNTTPLLVNETYKIISKGNPE
jgi:hypothetical protein